ncbi:hypothetical protein [Pseudomonas cremoricolorata]|uniref:hypothetical protein n=1 Tax=Pseudomonas cremoricolorata TaxID=157783 RepID=UPI0012B6167C|nr:hypothetical protein [Pseudomonas cremoricolorata]
MDKDKLIWPTIDSEVNRYVMFDAQNNLVPDLLSQEVILRSLEALRRFFLDEGLLTKAITDNNDKLLKVAIRASDFTEEGLTLVKLKTSAWRGSKSSKKIRQT